MIAAIFILQASKIRGEREFVMKTAMNTNINTNTTNSKKVIPGINDVATKCPKVAAMWSDKNTFSPSKVAAGSRRKFTFVCPDCGQEFESKIFSVVRSVMNGNTGCPVCAGKKIVSGINDVATKCPMAAAMWSDKNAFTPSEAPAGSHKKAIFVCPDCGQEFESSICNVVNSLMHYRTGCPVCRGLKVVSGINDLATKCPAAANMWGSKNACSPNEVSAGNNKMAWFVCPDCKQEFKAPVCNVVNSLLHDNTGCPVCAGRKAISGVNDLATKCPMAATMWSNKNACSPSEAPAGSHKKAVFVCPDCGQEFESSICNVVNSLMRYRTGCPVCRGLKVVSGINDLATKCPAAANMWSDKNACSPNEVSAGNNKMAWFVCPDCKQEFKAPVCNVVNSLLHDNTGCPVCAGRKAISGVNDLATKCPMAATMWSNKNACSPSEAPAGSHKKAVFVCPDCGQEFVASIHNMTRAIASGVTCCPNCRLRGRAINAARKDEYSSPKSVGTTMTMKDGSKATCTAYHGVNNITVEFEDGFVLYHARWNQFVRGALHHGQKATEE